MNRDHRSDRNHRTRTRGSTAIAIAVALLAMGASWATSWGGVTASAGTATISANGSSDVGLARRVTRALAENVGQVFVAARGQLVELSKLRAVRTQDVQACNTEMASRLSSRYTALEAADRSGNAYCSAPPLTSKISIADRAYFLRAIGTRGFAVGDFQIGRATGQKGIGVGYPTRSSSGAINGIVLSPLSLSWLDRYVARNRPRTAFDVLLVDDHGTVLARAGAIRTPSGRNLGANPLVKEMLTAAQGAGHFRLAGHAVTSAFRTVPSSDGAVHIAISVLVKA